MRTRWVALATLAMAGFWGACAEQRRVPLDNGLEAVAQQQQALLTAALQHADRGMAQRPLRAVDGRREGGRLLLADLEGRRLAFVADEDAAAVRVLDARTHQPLSHYPLPGRPAQLALAGDGRLYVALRDSARVQSLEVAAVTAAPNMDEGKLPTISLRDSGGFATAVEPLALATTPDGGALLVASGWGKRLQRFVLSDGRLSADLQLAREPRAVAISEDGQHAYVAHAMGSAITRVALNEPDQPKTQLWVGGSDHVPVKRRPISCRRCFSLRDSVAGLKGIGDGGGSPRHAVQGFALATFKGEVIAPLVLAHPGERPVGGYGTSGGFSAHQPVLAVVSADKDEVMVRAANRIFAASERRRGSAGEMGDKACFLPRAIAIDEARQLALVSCLGSDRVEAFQMKSASLVRSTVARWKVPAGPVGVAIDSAAGVALVWSQFASTLSTLTLPGMPEEQHVGTTFAQLPKSNAPLRVSQLTAITREGGPTQLSAAAKRGRVLFHAAGDKRISGDGRACASCHPDGREDGISWPTPQGRSQTPILAGRLSDDLAPYGWNGESDTVAKHVSHTFKRLGGRGLKGKDMAALMAYLQEMPAPPRMAAHGDTALAKRGKALFEADTVGCAVCHTAGGGSDGARHRIGAAGRELDTPSLRFVAGSAPYFHDGRYATLAELLRETKGKMGWAADMADDDLDAIEAYLMTL